MKDDSPTAERNPVPATTRVDTDVEAGSRRVQRLARRMARPPEADDIARQALLTSYWRILAAILLPDGFLVACAVDDGGLHGAPPPGTGAPSQPMAPPLPTPAPVPPLTVTPPPPVTTPPSGPIPPVDPISPPPSGPVAPPPPVMPPPAVPPGGPLPGECEPITRSLSLSTVRNVPPTGDLTFDNEGFLVLGMGRDIVRLARGGMTTTLVNNALPANRTIYGLRVVPDGSVFFSDNSTDILFRYDSRGDRRTFTMNAGSP